MRYSKLRLNYELPSRHLIYFALHNNHFNEIYFLINIVDNLIEHLGCAYFKQMNTNWIETDSVCLEWVVGNGFYSCNRLGFPCDSYFIPNIYVAVFLFSSMKKEIRLQSFYLPGKMLISKGFTTLSAHFPSSIFFSTKNLHFFVLANGNKVSFSIPFFWLHSMKCNHAGRYLFLLWNNRPQKSGISFAPQTFFFAQVERRKTNLEKLLPLKRYVTLFKIRVNPIFNNKFQWLHHVVRVKLLLCPFRNGFYGQILFYCLAT